MFHSFNDCAKCTLCTYTHTPVTLIFRVFKAAKNYSTLLPLSLSHSCWLVFFMFQLPSAKKNHFQSPSITADTKQLMQVAFLSSATAQRSCQQSWRQKSSSSYLMPILHKCKGIRKTHKNVDKCRFLLGCDLVHCALFYYSKS